MTSNDLNLHEHYWLAQFLIKLQIQPMENEAKLIH